MTTSAPGARYHCPHAVSVLCERGTGRPTRTRCAYCKGALVVEEGHYGVFEWRQDGRYPAEAAKSVHRTNQAAQRASAGTDYVVRFIPA